MKLFNGVLMAMGIVPSVSALWPIPLKHSLGNSTLWLGREVDFQLIVGSDNWNVGTMFFQQFLPRFYEYDSPCSFSITNARLILPLYSTIRQDLTIILPADPTPQKKSSMAALHEHGRLFYQRAMSLGDSMQEMRSSSHRAPIPNP